MSFVVAKAVEKRIVMLTGDEEGLRRRALVELLAELAVDEFDLETVDGATDPAEWLAKAGTAPFLSSRRVVIVRNLLRADIARLTPERLKSLPDSAMVALVADDEPGDDSRQQRLKTIRKNVEKIVAEAGGMVASFQPDPKNLQSAIKAEAKRHGKTIGDKAAETLAEMSGLSLSRAIEEMEKLALYVGDENQISDADVRRVVFPSREWNVFKMIDAVLAGNGGVALRHLRVMVGSANNATDVAYRSILPNLSRNLRMLWQARVCLDAGVGPGNAPAEILATFPDKPNLAKEPPYRQSSMMSLARKASLTRIAAMLAAVSDADAKLKGMRPSYSGIETLEMLVLEMSASTK